MGAFKKLAMDDLEEMIKTAKKEAVYVEDWEIHEEYINLIDSGVEHEQALLDAMDYALDLNVTRTREIESLAAECLVLLLQVNQLQKEG